ncbi:MAG: glycoside-pentoside-hexuronide (GPH):cation symporter [Clostridia bacterium]|nr:glycoside-pentoside-hexuronide (GPH):cation symporter [Clostridia bacterium]
MSHPVNSSRNKIGIKDSAAYAFGDAGNLLTLTFVSAYLKVFYSDVLALSMTEISLLFLLTRLWDCVNDPLWGLAVARIPAGKNGKYRQYINKVAFPLALAAAFCFFDFTKLTGSHTVVLALAYLSYTVYGMLYTGMNIPYGSLASVITDDPHGRNLLSTFRSIGGGIGGGIVSIVAPLVVYTKVEKTDEAGRILYDESGAALMNDAASGSGMLVFGAVCAGLSVIFYLLCWKGTKERIAHPPQEKRGLGGTYSALFRSRPFVVLAVTGFFISGQLQFNTFNQYLYKNYFENTKLSLLGTLATYVPMAVMIIFMPKLSDRFGKKELCTVGTALSAGAAILTAVVRPGRDQWLYFMIMLFIIGLGYSFVSITNWAVVTDVIDYQQYKTGRRDESAIYAVYTFSRKLGQTAADTGGALLLEKAGYNANNADMGYVPGVGDKLVKICTIIPAVIYTAVLLLYAVGYPLNKKRLGPVYEFVHRANAGAENNAEA